LCHNILCAALIFSVISVNHFVVSSFHLLILFDILHQTNYLFVLFLLFLLFLQLLHLFLFILFHISFISSTSSEYLVHLLLTSLMNSSFTPNLFNVLISPFFLSLFSVFSLLLIFSLILALTKNGLILFQHLSYFSHH